MSRSDSTFQKYFLNVCESFFFIFLNLYHITFHMSHSKSFRVTLTYFKYILNLSRSLWDALNLSKYCLNLFLIFLNLFEPFRIFLNLSEFSQKISKSSQIFYWMFSFFIFEMNPYTSFQIFQNILILFESLPESLWIFPNLFESFGITLNLFESF